MIRNTVFTKNNFGNSQNKWINTAFNNQKQHKRYKLKIPKPETPEKWKNFIVFKCSDLNSNNKKSQGIKRKRKVRPIKRKNNKLIESILKKALTWDLLDKYFKAAFLYILKELKESMDKT